MHHLTNLPQGFSTLSRHEGHQDNPQEEVGGGPNSLRAAEASYAPPWGVAGEAAALRRMRKATSPSSYTAAVATTSRRKPLAARMMKKRARKTLHHLLRQDGGEDDEEDASSPSPPGRWWLAADTDRSRRAGACEAPDGSSMTKRAPPAPLKASHPGSAAMVEPLALPCFTGTPVVSSS